jgi:AcrR family transcriptional regulator
VPRTLDPTSHAVRRDAFLDAAEGLIRSKGYEETSIQDVLDAAGASRGAFYHYFDSKAALLEAVVDRMTDGVIAVVEPVVADPRLSAPAKLQALLLTAGAWKAERSDLLLAFMRSWYAAENDLVRLRVARAAFARLTPLIARIVREGRDQGDFDCTSPDDAAALLAALFAGSADIMVPLFLDCRDGRVPAADVERFVTAYEEAMERILGMAPGSLVLVDRSALHIWLG